MTIDECTSEVVNLEAKLMRFPPRTPEDREFWTRRRAGIFQAVERLDIAVLHKAFNTIVEEAAESDNATYFPTVPEILAACQSVKDAAEPKQTPRRSPFRPAKHKCHAAPVDKNPALGMLATLSPYEAKHILCPASVPATCPSCGRQRVVKGIFDNLKTIYPASMTAGWNLNFKGLLSCEECEKADGSRQH